MNLHNICDCFRLKPSKEDPENTGCYFVEFTENVTEVCVHLFILNPTCMHISILVLEHELNFIIGSNSSTSPRTFKKKMVPKFQIGCTLGIQNGQCKKSTR